MHCLAEKNALSEFDHPKLNIPCLRSRFKSIWNLVKKNKKANKKQKTKKKDIPTNLPKLFSHVTVNTGIFFFGLITNKKYVTSLINKKSPFFLRLKNCQTSTDISACEALEISGSCVKSSVEDKTTMTSHHYKHNWRERGNRSWRKRR